MVYVQMYRLVVGRVSHQERAASMLGGPRSAMRGKGLGVSASLRRSGSATVTQTESWHRFVVACKASYKILGSR